MSFRVTSSAQRHHLVHVVDTPTTDPPLIAAENDVMHVVPTRPAKNSTHATDTPVAFVDCFAGRGRNFEAVVSHDEREGSAPGTAGRRGAPPNVR